MNPAKIIRCPRVGCGQPLLTAITRAHTVISLCPICGTMAAEIPAEKYLTMLEEHLPKEDSVRIFELE